MPVDLRSYFDESGDPGTRASSSDHFVLGGFTVSRDREGEISQALAAARAEFNYAPDKVLHFAGLPHDKRLRWAQIVGGLPIRAAIVCLCKRGGNQGTQITADQLYNWSCRLVMERCSWLARDDGLVTSLTFEHMKGYQKWKMKEYVDRLQNLGTQIKWDHLHTPIRFGSKKTHELLQVADCIASAGGLALQPRYDNVECGYLKRIAPVLWRRYGNALQYGLKVHPRLDSGDCQTDHAEVLALIGT